MDMKKLESLPVQLAGLADRKRERTIKRVDAIITALVCNRKPVNFNSVAQAAGVTRTYLYKQPFLRGRIESLRQSQYVEFEEFSFQSAPSYGNAAFSQLLAAKDRRIRELEAVISDLKNDLKVALQELHGRLS